MSLRVLIVDDDRHVRLALETLLRFEGHQVTAASNGREGLQRLHEDGPDVVILDLSMPVMSGFEFLRAQAEEPEMAGIPTIVVSGQADRLKARSLGADAVLGKPIDIDRLIALIDTRDPGPDPDPDLGSDAGSDSARESEAAPGDRGDDQPHDQPDDQGNDQGNDQGDAPD